MSSIKQIEANRRNAKRSTGPKTPEGKDKVRFNALVDGLRAQSVLLPSEDPNLFNEHLQKLLRTWRPQDDMEKSLVEQIAIAEWKMARLDRLEARLFENAELKDTDLCLSLSRLAQSESRHHHNISRAIMNLKRYREERVERAKENDKSGEVFLIPGLVWVNPATGERTWKAYPSIKGHDDYWRTIPRELLGDPDAYPREGDPPILPSPPMHNSHLGH